MAGIVKIWVKVWVYWRWC